MIGKRGRLLVLFYMIFLVILFLMCSTDLIIREPEKEIYQVAVIIEDVRDDNYGNFRKGMDQAAVEFNADVRFITLYERMDADQQMELLLREQMDGTDALIVAPVDESRVVRALEEKQVTVPVVLLGTEAGAAAAGTVAVDHKKMGEQLAEQILQKAAGDCPVFVVSDPERRDAAGGFFLEGAVTVLENAGCSCQMIAWEREQDVKGVMEDPGIPAGEQAVILAESPELLSETAGVLADTPSIAGRVQGLYGRGSALPVLNDLDRGLITGVCVTDEFGAGYYSVSMAIQALEGRAGQTQMQMDSYYIERQNLRETAYEKLLFPIE